MFVGKFCRTAVTMLAATLVSALLVVGCSDDDDNGGGGGDIGSHGHLFVGDWTHEWFSSGLNNEHGFLSFNANGEFCFYNFQKVENFWVGGGDCGDWSADANNIFFNHFGDGYSHSPRYTLTNNALIFIYCWENDYYDYDADDIYIEEYCDEEEVYTRGGSRPSGTIRNIDPALNYTAWHMSSAVLNFGSTWIEFHGVDYFDDYHNDQAWYTNGNRLFMLGLEEVPNSCNEDGYDCAYTVAETVEFTYTHRPRTSLRLVNSSRGIDDTWEYDEYDDYYKRRDESETDKRQNLFRRPQSRSALLRR